MKSGFFRVFKHGFFIIFTVGIIVSTCFTVYICTLPSIKIIHKIKQPCVCIDPGHGGKDTGATLGKRLEKEDSLRLSLQIKTKLEEKGIGVSLTRTNDTYITLEERCKLANKQNADLFVSIHRNSADHGKGVEVWIKNTPEQEDSFLAESILSHLKASNHVSNIRGIKSGYRKNADGNYYVNAHTKMPSCLVEVGFITNEEDNRLFDSYLEEYAQSIADAIEATLQSMQ